MFTSFKDFFYRVRKMYVSAVRIFLFRNDDLEENCYTYFLSKLKELDEFFHKVIVVEIPTEVSEVFIIG